MKVQSENVKSEIIQGYYYWAIGYSFAYIHCILSGRKTGRHLLLSASLYKPKVVCNYRYVCECTVVVDVRDGTTTLLKSILFNVAM